MVDTARSSSELKALLADNETENVSAADLRDLLESLHAALSGHGNGYGTYEDTATATTPIVAAAGVAQQLTCNSLGVNTRETRLYPGHTTSYWNTTDNRIELSELALDSIFSIRTDIEIETLSVSTSCTLHYDFYNSSDVFQFRVSQSLADVKPVSTIAQLFNTPFFVGPAVIGGQVEVLLECDKTSNVVVRGFAVFVWEGSNLE